MASKLERLIFQEQLSELNKKVAMLENKNVKTNKDELETKFNNIESKINYLTSIYGNS